MMFPVLVQFVVKFQRISMLHVNYINNKQNQVSKETSLVARDSALSAPAPHVTCFLFLTHNLQKVDGPARKTLDKTEN